MNLSVCNSQNRAVFSPFFCEISLANNTEAARNNLAVAKSLGLKGEDDNDMILEEGEEDKEQVALSNLELLKFEVASVIDSRFSSFGNENQDEPCVMAHPHHGCVLVKRWRFDELTSDALFGRLPGYGARSEVDDPFFPDPTHPVRCVSVPVRRENATDLVEQVMPNSQQERIATKRDEISALVKNALGQHVGYEVINRAYQAMSPPQEQWNIEFRVKPPYYFKSIEKCIVLKSGTSDCLIIFPLATEEPEAVEKKAKVVLMEGDE